MKPFEISGNNIEELKDANNRRMSRVFVPDLETMSRLGESVSEIQKYSNDFLVISNIEKSQNDELSREGLRFEGDAAYYFLTQLMTELTGKSNILRKPHGFSIGDCVDAVCRDCFVQVTELTIGNIRSCTENGGNAIAFFPKDQWNCFFNEAYRPDIEVNGLKTIRIFSAETTGIEFEDPCDGNRIQRMDFSAFEWLSTNGWMLEVYK